ncbi:hypothetical protein AWB76_00609 [Caballeronia temeraria]|uniref:Multidrug ABC transporter ATPase n=1 Tax=Caballeronia temeraria TaxID=1777137 RepID=A0A157ZFT7_9BURK|nr:hypothetical protein [Caballeronia temeraria]SAK44365.1 hypothetical protein AWB76_00609 [Caballeronia temeraria]
MTRFVRTARRRFGPISSKIASASRHFVPPKLSSWKLALYLIVFLLPGGSFVVLGMGWFENRHRRKTAAAPKKAHTRPMLAAPCSPCPGSGR